MAIFFSEEKFIDAWPEFQILAALHWEETELYRHGHEFNPDVARYTQFNETGFYRLYCVRNEEGKLIGDCGMYLTESMHTKKKSAVEDTWFLLKEYRKGRNAINFFKYIESCLKFDGINEIMCSAKITNRAGSLLEYMGYKHIANQYHKDI